jgi:hypothetical protein
VIKEAQKSPAICDVLLWTIVMGGIAASFTDHRTWFEERLGSRLKGQDKLHLRASWLQFKQRVSRFLWWDPVCDTPTRDLWKAALVAIEAQVQVR